MSAVSTPKRNNRINRLAPLDLSSLVQSSMVLSSSTSKTIQSPVKQVLSLFENSSPSDSTCSDFRANGHIRHLFNEDISDQLSFTSTRDDSKVNTIIDNVFYETTDTVNIPESHRLQFEVVRNDPAFLHLLKRQRRKLEKHPPRVPFPRNRAVFHLVQDTKNSVTTKVWSELNKLNYHLDKLAVSRYIVELGYNFIDIEFSTMEVINDIATQIAGDKYTDRYFRITKTNYLFL